VQVLEGESPGGDRRLVKIAEAKKLTGLLNLEVMALSKGSVRDVNLKDGSVVKKGEVVIGDDTGEITLVGWRGASEAIGEIKAGERLRMRGVNVQMSKMGVETLELGGASRIEKAAET